MRVPADRLWPLVSDTDRLNRAIGNPEIHFDTTPADQGGSIRKARMKFGPVHLRWQEMPFEWVRHEGFSVERVFESGPIERAVVNCTMAAKDDGSTQIGVQGELTPRGAAGTIAANLVVRKAVQDLIAQVRQIESYEEGKAAYPYKRAPSRAVIDEEALAAAAAGVGKAHRKQILDRIVDLLRTAYDEDVIRMRSFELADRWGENRMDVLKTFLAAAHAGMLELKWTPICPHCRGAKGETPSLRDLRAKGYCDACNVTFDLNFDEAIEVRFTASPKIRPTADAMFCSGGPATTSHVFAQARVPVRAHRTLSVAAAPGRYRLRSPQVKGHVRVASAKATAGRRPLITATPDGFSLGEFAFAEGRIEVEVVNDSAREMLLVLEEEAWDGKSATAAVVTSLQDFRELFDKEVLAPDNDLAIRSLTLLLSDLESASKLYAKVGDARACALMRQYFEFLIDSIREHNGGVVKTIGNNVMAAFSSGRDAVASALEIQRRVEEFNGRERLVEPISVKLALHRGPMIAVNFNDMLDYFGGTVQLASHLHDEAQGDDIVLSEALHSDPEIERVLKEQGVESEIFPTTMPDLPEPQRLMRVRI